MKSFHPQGFPAELSSLNGREARVEPGEDGLSYTVHAEAGDDLFRRPGTDLAVHSATVFAIPVDGDFRLSAEVEVDFREDFDSAVLVGYVDEEHWFKLCAERDELGAARVMSVVTQERSDDATGIHLNGPRIHLRISRHGSMFSLHSSHDGVRWDLARYFGLPEEVLARGLHAGLAVQSPRGAGTRATFRKLSFETTGVAEVRSGE